MSLIQTEFNKPKQLRLGGAADQLGFLLGQLEGTKINAIVRGVERLARIDGKLDADVDVLTPVMTKHAEVQQALARILYAVAGMSFEDRAFALTYAEIQAILDGANDECFETAYCQ